MKYLILALMLFASVTLVHAQTECPAGQVCIPQATANSLLAMGNQLIEAKDTINKLLTERTIAEGRALTADRVIADYKQLEEINAQMVAKYKDAMAMYEKVLTMYANLVETYEKKLNAPRSAWQKVASALKEIGLILAGISLGRSL